MNRLLFIALLGAVGTALRLVVSDHVARDATFPWGTLGINVVGSLLIGIIYTLGPDQLPSAWRTALGIGLLGGLTTYSTFAFETLRLVELGRIAAAGSYVAVTLVAGLAAVWAGAALGRAAS